MQNSVLPKSAKKRNIAFDYVKGFAIWLVVYGHCQQHLLELDRVDNVVYQFIYTFHMPLFMLISGYFSISSLRLNFIEFISKKFRTLILPVLTYSFFLTIFYLLFGNHGFTGINDVCLLFLGRCYAQLWFLKALFICNLFLYICKYSDFKWYILCGTIFVSQLIYDFHMPVMYPVFLIGFCIRKYNLINKLCKNIFLYWGLLLLFLALSIPYCLCVRILGYGGAKVGWYDELWNIYSIIMGSSVSVSILLYTVKFVKNQSSYLSLKEKVLAYIGANTLEVYILQSFLLEVVLARFLKMPTFFSLLTSSLIFIPFSFLIIFVCIVITKGINTNYWLSLWIFGKKNKLR